MSDVPPWITAKEAEAAIQAHAVTIAAYGHREYPDAQLPEVIALAKRIALLAETLQSMRAKRDS